MNKATKPTYAELTQLAETIEKLGAIDLNAAVYGPLIHEVVEMALDGICEIMEVLIQGAPNELNYSDAWPRFMKVVSKADKSGGGRPESLRVVRKENPDGSPMTYHPGA